MDRSARILDLGCGHGAFIYFLREAGYTDVVGVDKSPEQVAEAKRLGIDGVHEADLWDDRSPVSVPVNMRVSVGILAPSVPLCDLLPEN